MTLANLPQDNCFMPLPKPTGTDNGYFTIGMLPAPLSIPCEIAPYFAKFKEVTATNTPGIYADRVPICPRSSRKKWRRRRLSPSGT